MDLPTIYAVWIRLPDSGEHYLDQIFDLIDDTAQSGVDAIWPDTPHRDPLPEAQPGQVVFYSLAAGAAEVRLQDRLIDDIVDYHGAWSRDFEAYEFARGVKELPGRHWLQCYLERVRPREVAGVWIATPWHEVEGVPDELVIRLEPGWAFGRGDHPSTQLALRELLAVLRGRRQRPPRVVDIGCGTGILSIVAARNGAWKCVAVDRDWLSLREAENNCRINGVAHRVTTVDPTSELDRGQKLERGGPYDVVVANIDADVLAATAGRLARLLDPDDGVAILAGFRFDKIQIIAEHYERVDMSLAEVRRSGRGGENDWVAMVMKHRRQRSAGDRRGRSDSRIRDHGGYCR